MYKKGNHFLSDTRSIDGGVLQGESHAINDAKKNIETLHRLANDKKRYNKKNKE